MLRSLGALHADSIKMDKKSTVRHKSDMALCNLFSFSMVFIVNECLYAYISSSLEEISGTKIQKNVNFPSLLIGKGVNLHSSDTIPE